MSSCTKLTRDALAAKRIYILVARREPGLEWLVDSDMKLVSAEVEDDIHSDGACHAFQQALADASVTATDDDFTSDRWRKYAKGGDLVYVFMADEDTEVGEELTFTTDPLSDSALLSRTVRKVYRGSWWQRNWQYVAAGSLVAAAAAAAAAYYVSKKKTETTEKTKRVVVQSL